MENPSAGRNLCRTWKSVAMEKGTDSCGKYSREAVVILRKIWIVFAAEIRKQQQHN